MKLVVSRLATRRLTEIADYIHAHNPDASLRVQRAIRAAFDLLTTHPVAGRRYRLAVRRLILPRLPYAIYYRVDEAADEVVILTIRHTARRAP